jgi:hypothetical protein
MEAVGTDARMDMADARMEDIDTADGVDNTGEEGMGPGKYGHTPVTHLEVQTDLVA